GAYYQVKQCSQLQSQYLLEVRGSLYMLYTEIFLPFLRVFHRYTHKLPLTQLAEVFDKFLHDTAPFVQHQLRQL
ncbi:putative FHA domain containing protein, partial [Listeria innocua FSL S4-378]